jgi:hypothetical protein
MKELTLLIILLFLGFTSCTESPSACNDLCDSFSDEEFEDLFANHGDCVSLCATCSDVSESDNKLAVCVCNFIETVLIPDDGDWEDVGFKNKGQCVKAALRDLVAD